jgi:hypothetical protein
LVVRDPDEVIQVPAPPRNFEIIKVREGSELVEKRVEKDWHPEAMELWVEVWTSPMADEYQGGDYAAVRRLMLIEQALWEAAERGKTVGLATLTAEATRLSKQLGLTPMARRSLQWTVAQTGESLARQAGMRQPAKSIEATCEELPSIEQTSAQMDALYD